MHNEPALNPSPASEGISLRPEAAGDEALLFEWYASTREEELASTGWDSATRNAFLTMQFRAMRQGYRGMFPQGQFSIILAAGEPVGRLVVDRTAEEIHVVDIVVSAAKRNRDIGGQLLRTLMDEARHAGKPLRLQVLKSSRAVRFYQRLGLSKVGETEVHHQLEWRG